tara:strand:- start:11 stop:1480 length:1470 start_codon:yes stop_codon:yes gene_type:complete
MPKVFFHPDIDYQDIKSLENKYNSKIQNFLAEKASRIIEKEIIKFLDRKKRILFICGPGSNGLDGILVARNLYEKKYKLNILMNQNDLHKDYILKYDLSDTIIDNNLDFDSFDCIVDCIFGYGINRNLKSSDIKLVNLINQSRATVISVDIPTGVDPSTGGLLPVGVNCDLLITLLTYKKGIFTNKGRDSWKLLSFSRLVNERISSNNYLLTANKDFNDSSIDDLKTMEFEQKNNYSDHKKSNGTSCIIAGESPYHGALIMACIAAIKTGCKYLHAITESEYAHTLPIIIPEIISSPFLDSKFETNIKNYSNVLIGPGIISKGEEFVNIALNNLDTLDSLVIDAGGLLYLDKNKKYSNKLIITPHPGEAAKILDITTADVQADRYQSARELQNLFNCIVILKGSGTIIYDGKSFYTCMDGNYRMAVAGMGDVLSGILLRELSSPLNNIDACIKSVIYHAYASDYLLKHSKNKNYLPTMIPDIYSKLTVL